MRLIASSHIRSRQSSSATGRLAEYASVCAFAMRARDVLRRVEPACGMRSASSTCSVTPPPSVCHGSRSPNSPRCADQHQQRNPIELRARDDAVHRGEKAVVLHQHRRLHAGQVRARRDADAFLLLRQAHERHLRIVLGHPDEMHQPRLRQRRHDAHAGVLERRRRSACELETETGIGGHKLSAVEGGASAEERCGLTSYSGPTSDRPEHARTATTSSRRPGSPPGCRTESSSRATPARGRPPASDSSRERADRSTHQPTVSTARSAPSVCMPEPNVRSHGHEDRVVDRWRDREHEHRHGHRPAPPAHGGSLVLSVSPATSTSNAATSER